MKRKKKKVLAFLLTLVLMVSFAGRDQLFVAAENAHEVETESPKETEIFEEPSEPEKIPTESTDQSNPAQGDVNGTSASTDVVDTESASGEQSTEESSTEESTDVTSEGESGTETELETEETEEIATEAITEEETETEGTTEEEPENVEYIPEKQPEGITVRAYADKGVLPEGTAMKATKIAMVESKEKVNDDEEQMVADILDDSDVEYDGFYAMDISFYDGETEIEPEDGSVRVEFELDTKLLPAGLDADSLEVQHFAETDGEIDVQTVADASYKTDGKVEVKEQEEVIAGDFTVDSFSMLVVTFSNRANSDSASVDLPTIDTVDSASEGIVINLFDYDQETINAVTQEAFHFHDTPYNGSRGDAWNKWTGSNAGVYQGIMKTTLGNGGFPVLKPQIEGDSYNLNGNTSSSYLFSPNSDKVRSVKAGLNHLFTKDDKGYYKYDSSENFATIKDNDDNDFAVYDTAYRPGDSTANKPKFLPFNTLIDSNNLGEAANYLFGMTMNFNFIQPEGGLVSNNSMVFEFNGDDDVWVFIDGVLVLDLGGIHDAFSGSINFETGVVTVEKVSVSATNYGGNSSLYEIMKAVKGDTWVDNNFVQKGDNWVFKDYSRHSFNYYYLERGGYGSNCLIRFNIPTIPGGTIREEDPGDEPEEEISEDPEVVKEEEPEQVPAVTVVNKEDPVQVLPVTPAPDPEPSLAEGSQTGDSAYPVLWTGLLTMAVFAFVIIIMKRKKNENAKE